MTRKMSEVEYTFKNAMSVQDLAHIVSTIDMEEMIEGSKLEFIQKTNGCVSMTIPRQDDDQTLPMQKHCLLFTTAGSEWPFISDSAPSVVLENLRQGGAGADRWGHMKKGISGIAVSDIHDTHSHVPDGVQNAAHYVLQCIKKADNAVDRVEKSDFPV